MNHTTMRRLISTYVDGEADASVREEVLRHVRTCSECRIFERGLRALHDDIRSAGDLTLKEGFTGSVLQAVRQDEEEVRSWFPAERAARRLVVVLSVLALFFVGLATMARPEEPLLMEPYLTGEPADTSVSRSLLTKETISKDDVLFAALSRN